MTLKRASRGKRDGKRHSNGARSSVLTLWVPQEGSPRMLVVPTQACSSALCPFPRTLSTPQTLRLQKLYSSPVFVPTISAASGRKPKFGIVNSVLLPKTLTPGDRLRTLG